MIILIMYNLYAIFMHMMNSQQNVQLYRMEIVQYRGVSIKNTLNVFLIRNMHISYTLSIL